MSDVSSEAIAVVAAIILTPLLGWVLARAFPPKVRPKTEVEPPKHSMRSSAIEYSSVFFFMAGFGVPFVLQGSSHLKPTAANIALMFSFGGILMVVGTAALAALLGDRNAEHFLAYFESKRNVSASGVKFLAKMIVVTSIVALLLVALSN
jgi:hypothetical protein